LDHVTARVVAELAAVLLPPLETAVAVEVSKALNALPKRSDQAFNETLTSLKQLQESGEAIAGALNAAKDSIGETSADILPAFSRISERMDVAAAQLEQCISQLVEQAIAGPKAKFDALGEVTKSLHTVESAISNWEGILKAEGRVQTRELSEFSSEVLELVKDMRSDLPRALRETVEKAVASRDDEWTRVVRESSQAIEAKLAGFEKIVALVGIVIVTSLAVIAMVLLGYLR
jgi:DNA repair exonuclease SbcCD ATPase subunit